MAAIQVECKQLMDPLPGLTTISRTNFPQIPHFSHQTGHHRLVHIEIRLDVRKTNKEYETTLSLPTKRIVKKSLMITTHTHSSIHSHYLSIASLEFSSLSHS